MAPLIEQVKEAVGERFALFRATLFQSRRQLAEEAGTTPDLMLLIEKGIIMPDLLFLEYYFREYCLNLTWLLTGNGNMFYAKGPKTPADIYEFCQSDEPGSPAFKRFQEHRRYLHEYVMACNPREAREQKEKELQFTWNV
jgi:transcriptional regulator with XRE-family HTH domain